MKIIFHLNVIYLIVFKTDEYAMIRNKCIISSILAIYT